MQREVYKITKQFQISNELATKT